LGSWILQGARALPFRCILLTKVKALTEQVQTLRLENETLRAEVELYREEAAVANIRSLSMDTNKGDGDDAVMAGNTAAEAVVAAAATNSDLLAWMQSGNGRYPQQNEITLPHLHGNANVLCCALSTEDTILATGGADGTLRLVAWGPAWVPAPSATHGGNKMSDDADAAWQRQRETA